MSNGDTETGAHAVGNIAASTRRAALSAILLLLLILLILMLIAAATERTDILRFAGVMFGMGSTLALQPQINANAVQVVTNAPGTPANAQSGEQFAVDNRFLSYYEQRGGQALFGKPISPAIEHQGRMVQWFEKARIESWPEQSGTPYEVQLGRIGAEYTAAIQFPQQTPFTDRPGARYFPQTGHGVITPFLNSWETLGGIETLGYPISEQVQEVLPNGLIYTVQYFERGRLEHYPERSGQATEIQLGALGSALYRGAASPRIFPPARPTPVAAP